MSTTEKIHSDYSRYIAASRYARYLDDKDRRETWDETVTRYCDFFSKKFGDKFPYDQVKKAITNFEVMPSMRGLMTAGDALDRDNIAIYNCSYLPIDHVRAFDEVLYILMCGVGVGFSVERQFITNLPTIPEELHNTPTTIQVRDSRVGWATAFKELLSLLYSGMIPKWDMSKVRESGTRLKTFGGRSSGPEPLHDLFNFTVASFKKATGRKFNSLECHDLVCKIADIVVVGGVRRSALISLSNLTDERMRGAKNGQWWDENVQRALANNSVAYTEKPDVGIFMEEWKSLYDSKSGERGIFNRVSATRKAASTGRRETIGHHFGTNPCGEIVLRGNGLCNLTEVVVRSTDTLATLRGKVELATLLGTFQAAITDFRYLRPIWKKNAEEERLLGVSLTGIMDHNVLSKMSDSTQWLKELKDHAIETNKLWAEKLGINPSAAITTVKPSGTVSQLVGSASGIHPRHSPYYVRTVRSDIKDPLAQFLISQGVPFEPDITKPDSVMVFSFPIKSPDTAIFRDGITAIQQLEHYLMVAKSWTEHNPSITVYVRENEWMEVGAWVYNHFNELGGVSFLPHSDHVYKQAPYQDITEEEYEQRATSFPDISWSSFIEHGDNTKNAQTLSCVAGFCEVL